MTINISNLISKLESQGSGEDLEYDPDFLELSKEVTGGEETQYGEHVYTPEPINWLVVESLCLKLFQRTQDLRVGVFLARAWLELGGLGSFVDGVQLLLFLLRERWSSVHPQLLAEEQFDPLIRINALAELVVPSTVIATLRCQSLARSETGEELRCADLALIASGGASNERNECLARLGRFIEPQCSAELMQSLERLNRLKSLLSDIGKVLVTHTGLCTISPLQPLVLLLQQWIQVLEGGLGNTSAQAVINLPYLGDTKMNSNQPLMQVGECRSREEVLKMLGAIEVYYHRHEPSSPIPMLLRRVKRLVGMEFIDIIAELAPTNVDDIRALGGTQEE